MQPYAVYELPIYFYSVLLVLCFLHQSVSPVPLFQSLNSFFCFLLSVCGRKPGFGFSKKRDKCFVKVMLMPWHLLRWWFIAAEPRCGCMSMCCWPGSESVSAQFTPPFSWRNKDLIPSQQQHDMHRENTTVGYIHNNLRINHLRKILKYLRVWPFLATRTPKSIIDALILALAETSANAELVVHSLQESSSVCCSLRRRTSRTEEFSYCETFTLLCPVLSLLKNDYV